MKRKDLFNRRGKELCVLVLLVAIGKWAEAQAADGQGGITSATNAVAGYFDVACNLMYAIGGITGLIGAVKVYQKWNSGDHEVGKLAAAWFGSCVFLVIVATVLKSFFGLT